MGSLIPYPAARPATVERMRARGASATIIILPVVRIERHPAATSASAAAASSARKRKHRASRS